MQVRSLSFCEPASYESMTLWVASQQACELQASELMSCHNDVFLEC